MEIEEDLITKSSIEEQAAQEVATYKSPLIALITARMLKNKADFMADFVMSKAVDELKQKPNGKFEFMGVTVSLVKGKTGAYFVKDLDAVISEAILMKDEQFTEESITQLKTEVEEQYNDETGELLHLENLLFEIEQFRDKKIAEINKIYETDIALAKRAIDEKKTALLQKSFADITISEPSAKVNFPQ